MLFKIILILEWPVGDTSQERGIVPLNCLQNLRGSLSIDEFTKQMFLKMNDQQSKIVAEAEKTVTELLKTKLKPLFVFHNLFHTQQVVKATKEMIDYYHINDSNQFILLIAAWFHDTGFVSGKAEGHEIESCRRAEAFLNIYHIDQQLIQRVSSCIRSTRMPQTPTSFEEKIICDADLYNLGTELFIQMTNNLRLELQNYFDKEITTLQWCLNNITFLQSHKYFTAYCQQKLEPMKQAWLRQLQRGNACSVHETSVNYGTLR